MREIKRFTLLSFSLISTYCTMVLEAFKTCAIVAKTQMILYKDLLKLRGPSSLLFHFHLHPCSYNYDLLSSPYSLLFFVFHILLLSLSIYYHSHYVNHIVFSSTTIEHSERSGLMRH